MAKKQNTSAPTASSKPADVLAPAVASAAAQADTVTVSTGALVNGVESIPPVGEATGDGTGEKLADLIAESMTVTSQVDGFRRGGIAWSTTPISIALDELSEDQIVAIAAEPLLDVVFKAAPAAD